MKKTNRTKYLHRNSGVTLIELMVVVAIIGIIASIAVPNYQEYVLRTNRGDGMSGALDILRAQENFSITNLTYTTNLTVMGYPNPYDSPNGRYRFTAETCGAAPITDCVNIVATALGAQIPDGNLTINSRGQRTGNW